MHQNILKLFKMQLIASGISQCQNSAVSALLHHRLPFTTMALDWSINLVIYYASGMCEVLLFTHTLNYSAEKKKKTNREIE